MFDIIAINLQIVPLEDFAESFGNAEKAMHSVDEKDAAFLALALSIDCDGIWSNDTDLKKQRLIKVWNTIELVKTLDKV